MAQRNLNTSGLIPYKKGQGGRKLGAKDKYPRAIKGSVRQILEELSIEDRAKWKAAISRAMNKGGQGAFAYFQLAAHYLDGKPAETVKVSGTQPIQIVMPGPDPDEDITPTRAEGTD